MRDKKSIHFCTGGNSPEVILFVIVPIITLSTLLVNNLPFIDSVAISLIGGVSIYLFITVVKNIVATFLKSDLACKIPKLDNHRN